MYSPSRVRKTGLRQHYRRQPGGERVVRIQLGGGGRTYSYLCAGNPMLGSLVRVHTPVSGEVTKPVVGFGRGWWFGPLKRATLVHR